MKKEQKVAYISGPFGADSVEGVIQNIEKAKKVALKYWKLGYAVICPHANSPFIEGELPESVFLAGDLTLLGLCDVVVMTLNWRKSVGARKELKIALSLKKEVLYDDGK